ncbi:glycosyltransferase family 2 protein [uncultured Mucilaginibacter sp.]|uniref:glycosyltransferase family 2 protein n=1 Tax=uncultured Mucilaginibacter sp. TaxID=797541 RepID=UPI00262F150F|nr:glycosyltransferase family 2 protein [uncultured Mucilaginibacter sp.]
MLSVAMCTYNGEEYLDQQLNSILNQSESVDEIIICDDKSTDTTIKIIQSFQKQLPDIIKLHINKASLGPIKNFEKAISLCTGEIVFLSDQDDVWAKDKVKKIVRKFQDDPGLEAVFTDANLIDQHGMLLGKTLFENLDFNLHSQKEWSTGKAFIEILYYRNKITGATMAFKKSLFEKVVPFLILKNFWHDAQLGLHAALENKLDWINEPLIEYRIHDKQQVGLGNGTTLLTTEKISSRDFLTQNRLFPSSIILIIESLLTKYPKLDKENLEKEALSQIQWLDLRLQLPKNIFSRTYIILNNISAYKKHSNSLLKSIIKDIINLY